MQTADFSLDTLFMHGVSAIDRGDLNALQDLLIKHPDLAVERLRNPGAWLRDQIEGPLNSFFHDPYLLWFVAEDPVRNDTLPSNIAEIATTIIGAAERQSPGSLNHQITYALRLVAWSSVARRCMVQIPLIDVFVNAGAPTDGVSNDALVNGNIEAAEHLIKRGAKLTLPTAVCLGYMDEAARLVTAATLDEKQFSLVLSALNGKENGVAAMLRNGADINKSSANLFAHATPLHHAVFSGSLKSVQLLVEAGANLHVRDTIYNGTPLGWAEYGRHEAIAEFLKEKGAK